MFDPCPCLLPKKVPLPPPQTRLWGSYFVLRLPPRQPGSVPKSGRRPDSIFNQIWGRFGFTFDLQFDKKHIQNPPGSAHAILHRCSGLKSLLLLLHETENHQKHSEGCSKINVAHSMTYGKVSSLLVRILHLKPPNFK